MTSYSYRRDDRGWEYLISDPNGPTGQLVTRLGNSMVNYGKQYANVDTGNMRSRIEFRLETDGHDLVGILAARTNYAIYVHEGTLYYEGNPFLLDAARTVLGQ